MADIVIFGATGFTGRLVTEYLYAHPDRSRFTLGISGRSKEKIAALQAKLHLDESVKVFYADVLKREEVEAVVKQAKVVIAAVGPFWKYGTPLARACAENGVHYVDLAGEPHWIHKIIIQLDYLASKTHAIMIPAAGFDSAPSDLAVYLGNKALKERGGPDACIDSSVSGFSMKGGPSGGTVQTIVNALTGVPRAALKAGFVDWALSTGLKGVPSPPTKLVYTLPFTSPLLYGGRWFMRTSNRAIVQRSWGINQLRASNPETTSEETRLRAYGPEFKYDEFKITNGWLSAVFTSVVFAASIVLLAFPPLRWLFEAVAPKAGEGPSEETIQNGWLHIVNISSTAPSPTKPQTVVRTVFKGKGDPGYSLAAVMISESALALLLDNSRLADWVRVGGVLTPATALGDVLVERLEKSGRITFTSEPVLAAEQ